MSQTRLETTNTPSARLALKLANEKKKHIKPRTNKTDLEIYQERVKFLKTVGSKS